MGPIMAIGYGAGTYDFQLVRQGLRNLGIAIVISLITSIIYFMTSPLNAAQSELLARTTPSIWDVLIAIFGGLAGVVGATRKDKPHFPVWRCGIINAATLHHQVVVLRR